MLYRTAQEFVEYHVCMYVPVLPYAVSQAPLVGLVIASHALLHALMIVMSRDGAELLTTMAWFRVTRGLMPTHRSPPRKRAPRG